MKIAFISNMTPYKENYNGTSALPYHMMLHRNSLWVKKELNLCEEDNIEIDIYSFNLNNLPYDKIKDSENSLNVRIHVMSIPRWFRIMMSLHILFLRLFLKYPIHYYLKLSKKYIDVIKAKSPDALWIYGEEMSNVSDKFPDIPKVHTTVDCTSLYYYRLLHSDVKLSIFQKVKTYINFKKFLRLEKNYPITNIKYHLVGEGDRNFLVDHAPKVNAFFIRHPHYEISKKMSLEALAQRKFNKPIRVLIAGQNNIYMRTDIHKIITLLCDKDNKEINDFIRSYTLTFLGKGWENYVSLLKSSGWDVYHKIFVEDYIGEVSKHDIQLTPIDIGTGTKGKVLDALANGLLVIGSGYAIENIAVENQCSCLEYHKASDVLNFLKDIPTNLSKYEGMARCGYNNVLKYHGRERVARDFFKLFM